jgi:hypothetical protein
MACTMGSRWGAPARSQAVLLASIAVMAACRRVPSAAGPAAGDRGASERRLQGDEIRGLGCRRWGRKSSHTRCAVARSGTLDEVCPRLTAARPSADVGVDGASDRKRCAANLDTPRRAPPRQTLSSRMMGCGLRPGSSDASGTRRRVVRTRCRSSRTNKPLPRSSRPQAMK